MKAVRGCYKTSSYKINEYWGCNVQRDKYNEHSRVLYVEVVKRANPKSSRHIHKCYFYCFNLISLWDDGWSLNLS